MTQLIHFGKNKVLCMIGSKSEYDTAVRMLIKDYKSRLLIIDVDTIKFENRPEDFQTITDKIDAELFGLFPTE